MNIHIHTCALGNGGAGSWGKDLRCYNLSLIFKLVINITMLVLFSVGLTGCAERVSIMNLFHFFKAFHCFIFSATLLATPKGGCAHGGGCAGGQDSTGKTQWNQIRCYYHFVLPRITQNPPSAGLFLLALEGEEWEQYFLSKMFP